MVLILVLYGFNWPCLVGLLLVLKGLGLFTTGRSAENLLLWETSGRQVQTSLKPVSSQADEKLALL